MLGAIFNKHNWLNVIRSAFPDGYRKVVYKFWNEINAIVEYFS